MKVGRLQKKRFRKARSVVSVTLKCEARKRHTPSVFTLAPDLSIEYRLSLTFVKYTTVLQSIKQNKIPGFLKQSNFCKNFLYSNILNRSSFAE